MNDNDIKYYEKKIWLRKRNKTQEPYVVYVSHYSKTMGTFICYVLNTNGIVFSKKEDLKEFNFDRYLYEKGKFELIKSIQTQVYQNFKLKTLRKKLFGDTPIKTFLFKIKGKS